MRLSADQIAEFNENGFVILEDFLKDHELSRLLEAVDTVVDKIRSERQQDSDVPIAVRNVLSHHDAFLDLIDHPRMLPLVVDAIGWNIQVRTSHLDYRPPYPQGLRGGEIGRSDGDDVKAGYKNLSWHPDLAGEHMFEAPSLDGRLPYMEIKVFYSLSDLSESNCGNLWVVPGSHLRSPQELRELKQRVPANEALELKTAPGSAVLWRTAVWHCVGPNYSNLIRKILHVGYHYRWLRPTDYVMQDSELLSRSSPIRRQLLGALGTDGHPLGTDPANQPVSQYWLTDNQDDVPLRAWAEKRLEQYKKSE